MKADDVERDKATATAVKLNLTMLDIACVCCSFDVLVNVCCYCGSGWLVAGGRAVDKPFTRRLCRWSSEGVTTLSLVIKKYECDESSRDQEPQLAKQ